MDSDNSSGEKGPETEMGKCSIVGCGQFIKYHGWPYCEAHEDQFEREWEPCGTPTSGDYPWCPRLAVTGTTSCSLHGGADYVPRTHEEPPPLEEQPCIICRVPIRHNTPDCCGYTLRLGQPDEVSGRAHGGCLDSYQYIQEHGSLMKGKGV